METNKHTDRKRIIFIQCQKSINLFQVLEPKVSNGKSDFNNAQNDGQNGGGI